MSSTLARRPNGWGRTNFFQMLSWVPVWNFSWHELTRANCRAEKALKAVRRELERSGYLTHAGMCRASGLPLEIWNLT